MTLKALFDPTHRHFLQFLRCRDMTADEFHITNRSFSKRFKVLKDADLIQGAHNGTSITYTLKLSVFGEIFMSPMETFDVSPRKKSNR